jgi:hypothetical protein
VPILSVFANIQIYFNFTPLVTPLCYILSPIMEFRKNETLPCILFSRVIFWIVPAGRWPSSVQLFSTGAACLINTLYSDESGAVGALHVDEPVGSVRGGIVKVGFNEGIHSVIEMRASFPYSVDQIRGACGAMIRGRTCVTDLQLHA